MYINWPKLVFSLALIRSTFVLSNFKNYIMKNLRKSVLIVLMSLMSLSGFAGNATGSKEPNVTRVSFERVKKGTLLLIKDKQGLVLYKEAIAQAGNYSKGFDLTSLPDGVYFFELDSEMEIIVIPFEVASSEVIFKKEEKSTIFKPVVRVKDDMVFLSRVSSDAVPMEYKIYYAENSDLVLSEKFENETHVKRVYDFSKAEKGDYVFVFRSNGRKYTRTVKI